MFKCLHNVCTNIIKKNKYFSDWVFRVFLFKCKHLHRIENNVRTKCDWRIFIFHFFLLLLLIWILMMNHNGKKTISTANVSMRSSQVYTRLVMLITISSLGLLIKLVLHPKCYSTMYISITLHTFVVDYYTCKIAAYWPLKRTLKFLKKI